MAWAQDDASRDKEIQELRQRLEALEAAQAQQQQPQLPKSLQQDPTAAPGAAVAADPVEKHWYDSVKVGGGVRASFQITSDTNSKLTGYGYHFADESARLYTSGNVNDWISATLNAEFTDSQVAGFPLHPEAGVLDAIAQFKLMQGGELNVWAGRMLPACDRSNSDGPYYLATWNFPFTSVNFNNETNGLGRSDGVTVWGDVSKFKYWVGAYEGDNVFPSTSHLAYAARIQYDFFDPETGYYLASTYYGKQRTLAIGMAMNGQSEALQGVAGLKGSMNFEIDALYEDKIGELGVLTIEADYYRYQRGGYGENGVTAGDIGDGQGDGFLVLVAWLVPGNVGPGQFQPHIRYQGFAADQVDARNPVKHNAEELAFGVNYVIEGHNARITVVYSLGHLSHPAVDPAAVHEGARQLLVGAQVQF